MKVPGRLLVRNERSQIIVLTALFMIIAIAFAGLAVDVGYFYTMRRRMQTAADAAAVAAANQFTNGTSDQAAQDVATLDGFTNGQNGTTVAVNDIAAPAGYPSGTYIQVTVSRSVPTYFLRVLGYTAMNVSTNALAGTVNGASTIIALNGSSSGITVDNGASVTVGGGTSNQGGCGVISNSSITVNGSISAPSIGAVGGCSGNKPSNFKSNVPPAPNPFKSLSAPSGHTCTRSNSSQSGTYTCSSSQTISPKVYSGGYSQCGYTIKSPVSNGNYTPINVTFSGGTWGNHISCGGSGQPTVQNAAVTFNPGQYQCAQSSGFGWGGSTSTPSVEIGPNASNCHVNFNPGSYTFLGNVSVAGNNTVTLSPGTYYGGITVTGASSGGSGPDVTFAPGTYYLGGGGLQVTGTCNLHGSGVTFYNTSDSSSLSSSAGPISIGANSGDSVHCSLSAPTSGSCKGILFAQDSSIGSSGGRWGGWWYSGSSTSAHNCSVKGTSDSTFDGAIYTPNASLKYCGSSSNDGYTILVADSVEMKGGSSMAVNCDYSSLDSQMSPITTSALYH
jgi:Flp pilus assembly protein TadG